MSPHATTEMLSLYLDRELDGDLKRRVEAHLEDCPDCRERFAGLRQVVSGLKRLERLAPPPTLGPMVARRVALDGDREGLLDRLEGRLGGFERQSSLLPLFGLVVAFAVMILLFAQALEKRRNATIPVVFTAPEVSAPVILDAAGRQLHHRGDLWVEDGVDPGAAPDRVVSVDAPEWRQLTTSDPRLTELALLDDPALVRLGDEIVRIEPAVSYP